MVFSIQIKNVVYVTLCRTKLTKLKYFFISISAEQEVQAKAGRGPFVPKTVALIVPFNFGLGGDWAENIIEWCSLRRILTSHF